MLPAVETRVLTTGPPGGVQRIPLFSGRLCWLSLKECDLTTFRLYPEGCEARNEKQYPKPYYSRLIPTLKGQILFNKDH